MTIINQRQHGFMGESHLKNVWKKIEIIFHTPQANKVKNVTIRYHHIPPESIDYIKNCKKKL